MSIASFVRVITKTHAPDARLAAWSAWGAEGIQISLPTKDGQTGNAHAPLSATESCVIRYKLIWDDGKVSRGSIARFGIETRAADFLESARREAIDDPDSAYVLDPGSFPAVSLFDDATARLAQGETAAWAGRLRRIRSAVRDAGVRTWSCSLRAASAHIRFVSSSGIDVSSPATSTSWWVSLDGEFGDGESARAAEPDADFDARVERTTRIAALLRIPQSGGTAGLRTLLLHPKVVSGLFLDSLLHHLDGRTVARNEGWFRWAQFGSAQPVLREDLTLRLDPLQPLQSGSYRFTPDGVPAAAVDFIHQGRVLTPAASLKYARVLGIAPTPLPHGTEGLSLDDGNALSLHDAYRLAAGGALVLNVLGLHTLDTASGDFSLSAPQILALGESGPTGRFRATISGNLLEVLRSEGLRMVDFPGERHPGVLLRCRLDPR